MYLQTFLLFCGTVFAWSNVIRQMSAFLDKYGTLLHFKDCAIPNPLLTACLYGSIAFLVALGWSLKNLQNPENERSQKYLRNFLLFCVLFAGTMVFLEAADFYKWFKVGSQSVPISCTPGLKPTKTPCFTGMIFFILSYLNSIFVYKK